MAIVRTKSALAAIVGLGALLLAGGCNQRTISITSEPMGALVRLNDVEVGRTPLEVDFTYYGVYDVRLTADGYVPLATSAEAVAPFYEYPGPDLVTSTTKTHVRIRWSFALEPLPTDKPRQESELIERARMMRTDNTPAAPEAEAAPHP